MRAQADTEWVWRICSTRPMSGQANMQYDQDTLAQVERDVLPPTLRFFEFDEPTVTFGRLQERTTVQALVPPGWAIAQRPTGGGIVFHEKDLCFSLVWPIGQPPIPTPLREQYYWIHSIVLAALSDDVPARMAGCGDEGKTSGPFAVRACFQNPARFDILSHEKKIVGGALRRSRQATLYQGSLQHAPRTPAIYERLVAGFKKGLSWRPERSARIPSRLL